MLETWSSIPFNLQVAVVVALGILFLVVSRMTQSRGFKKQVTHSKQVKGEVVKYLLRNLDAAHYLTTKTIRDNEVVGVYNTETIILGLKAVSKLEKIDNRLNILENSHINSQVSSYVRDIRQSLSEIYHMENHLYEHKKKSQQIIISYDREFIKLSADLDNSEKAADLKQSFHKEINNYKQMVMELENSYKAKRELAHTRLHSLNEHNESIQNFLEDYRRKHVDSKKLYLTKLTYA